MIHAVNESTGYIHRESFSSEFGLRSQVYDMDFGPKVSDFGPMVSDFSPMVLDFGPMIMVLKRLHMSIDACFIILSCENTLNGIHDSFASRYP